MSKIHKKASCKKYTLCRKNLKLISGHSLGLLHNIVSTYKRAEEFLSIYEKGDNILSINFHNQGINVSVCHFTKIRLF